MIWELNQDTGNGGIDVVGYLPTFLDRKGGYQWNIWDRLQQHEPEKLPGYWAVYLYLNRTCSEARDSV